MLSVDHPRWLVAGGSGAPLIRSEIHSRWVRPWCVMFVIWAPLSINSVDRLTWSLCCDRHRQACSSARSPADAHRWVGTGPAGRGCVRHRCRQQSGSDRGHGADGGTARRPLPMHMPRTPAPLPGYERAPAHRSHSCRPGSGAASARYRPNGGAGYRRPSGHGENNPDRTRFPGNGRLSGAPSPRRTNTPCGPSPSGVERKLQEPRQAKAGSVEKVRPPGRSSPVRAPGTHAEHAAIRPCVVGLRQQSMVGSCRRDQPHSALFTLGNPMTRTSDVVPGYAGSTSDFMPGPGACHPADPPDLRTGQIGGIALSGSWTVTTRKSCAI